MPRRKVTIELRPEDYDQLREHCDRIDEPMAIWLRRQVKLAIQAESEPMAIAMHPAWLARFYQVCARDGLSPQLWIQRQIEAKIRGIL